MIFFWFMAEQKYKNGYMENVSLICYIENIFNLDFPWIYVIYCSIEIKINWICDDERNCLFHFNIEIGY